MFSPDNTESDISSGNIGTRNAEANLMALLREVYGNYRASLLGRGVKHNLHEYSSTLGYEPNASLAQFLAGRY